MIHQENKNKHNLETIVGNTLRYGVWVSLCLSFIGICVILIKEPHSIMHLQQLPDVPQKFSFIELLNGIKNFDAVQIAMLGVFILLITPLLRVIFALFAYWHEGNKLYTLITAIVLVIIAISVWIGAAH